MVILQRSWGPIALFAPPLVFTQSVRFPNRLQLLADYVEQGGALGMMGGYMTFQGIGGKGCYHGSPIEKALPVDFLPYDDRQEHPEGIDLKVDPQRHPALKGAARGMALSAWLQQGRSQAGGTGGGGIPGRPHPVLL